MDVLEQATCRRWIGALCVLLGLAGCSSLFSSRESTRAALSDIGSSTLRGHGTPVAAGTVPVMQASALKQWVPSDPSTKNQRAGQIQQADWETVRSEAQDDGSGQTYPKADWETVRSEAQDDGSGQTYPIDLPTALRLTDAQNPLVAFAREQINEALALQEAADVLWLPSLRTGVSWNKHEGTLQIAFGDVFDVSRSAFYAGLGAGAAGTGSPPISGVYAAFHVADAIFQPLAACQYTRSRQAASEAVRNNVLLDVSLAYLELLRATQDVTIAEETRRHAAQLAERTDAYARTGQGPPADADRAHTELALRQNDVQRATEAVEVAAARLSQLLHLDPAVHLELIEPAIVPIQLVPDDQPLSELVARALTSRPELAESQFLVSQATELLRRETFSSILPSLILGTSYGSFGGNDGGDLVNFDDRWDLDVIAFWELRNFGFGDRAARQATRSRLEQARWRQVAMMDLVAREVSEAYAQVQARRRQIETAKGAVQTAISSYQRNFKRIENAIGLPIEVLQAIQALAQARREYLRAVTDYNAAQFSLHRALGWAVHDVQDTYSQTAEPADE